MGRVKAWPFRRDEAREEQKGAGSKAPQRRAVERPGREKGRRGREGVEEEGWEREKRLRHAATRTEGSATTEGRRAWNFPARYWRRTRDSKSEGEIGDGRGERDVKARALKGTRKRLSIEIREEDEVLVLVVVAPVAAAGESEGKKLFFFFNEKGRRRRRNGGVDVKRRSSWSYTA